MLQHGARSIGHIWLLWIRVHRVPVPGLVWVRPCVVGRSESCHAMRHTCTVLYYAYSAVHARMRARTQVTRVARRHNVAPPRAPRAQNLLLWIRIRSGLVGS